MTTVLYYNYILLFIITCIILLHIIHIYIYSYMLCTNIPSCEVKKDVIISVSVVEFSQASENVVYINSQYIYK